MNSNVMKTLLIIVGIHFSQDSENMIWTSLLLTDVSAPFNRCQKVTVDGWMNVVKHVGIQHDMTLTRWMLLLSDT